MPEYLIKLHGDYFAGAKRTWWAERLEEEADLESTLTEIEEQVSVGHDLICVLCVDCVDGQYVANDVTDTIKTLLTSRETERLVERFHEGGHNFHSLAGYLAAADRVWPEGGLGLSQGEFAKRVELERVPATADPVGFTDEQVRS